MVKIEIITKEKQEVFKALTSSDIVPNIGDSFLIEGNSELVYFDGLGKNLTQGEIITFVLGFLSNFSVNIFSSYVYDKLNKQKYLPTVSNIKQKNLMCLFYPKD